MKIKQFAGGGIVYLPTTNRTTEEAVQETTSSKESTKKPVDKLLDIVKEKGLDSDVAAFTQQTLMKLQMGADPNGEELTQRDLVQLSRTASSVATNYERYKTAVQNVTSQNAESDIAIDDRGRIYCYNSETKKIKAISKKELLDDSDNLTPITYAELLDYRRQSPDLAFDTKIIDDVNNAIGIGTIIKDLNDIISKFKPSTVEGYSLKQQNQIATGLQAIVSGDLQQNLQSMMAAGPDGVYKIKQSATIADQGLEAAAKYLLGTLSNKAQRKLEAKAFVEGYDTKAMLLTMLVGNTERTMTADWEGQLDNEGKLSKTPRSEKQGSEVQHTLAESYADGANLPPEQRIQISPVDSDTSLLVSGQNAGPIRKTNGQNPGDPMPAATNVAQVLEDAYGLREITNDTIVFGDQLISRQDLGGLVYDGSNMYRVVLPCKTVNGRDIVPDYELQDKLDAIIKNGEEQGLDNETIQRYVNQACPGAKYDAEHGIIVLPKDRQHVFLTFGAVAADNYIGFDGNSKYLVKENGEETGPVSADAYIAATKYGYANPQTGEKQKARTAGSASKDGLFG